MPALAAYGAIHLGGLSWASVTLYSPGSSSASLTTPSHSLLLLLFCFTHSHFPHFCPSPSRLPLHQLLFDFNNLYLQMTPKLVFVAPACFLSSDPLVPLPAGYLNRRSHRTSTVAHPKPSLSASSKPAALSVPARGTPTALRLLPHLASGQSPILMFPLKNFWSRLAPSCTLPGLRLVQTMSISHPHVSVTDSSESPCLQSCSLAIRAPLWSQSISSTAPAVLYLCSHFKLLCLQRSPTSFRWLRRRTFASLCHLPP